MLGIKIAYIASRYRLFSLLTLIILTPDVACFYSPRQAILLPRITGLSHERRLFNLRQPARLAPHG